MGLKQDKIPKNKPIFNVEEMDKLNIFVCGNINEFQKYNRKEIKVPLDYNSTWYNGKHSLNKWYFNFYNKDMNENTEIINEIKDDIKKNIRDKKDNNILLIFLYSSEDKEAYEKNRNIFSIILDIFEQLSIIYKPILLFAIKGGNEEDKNNELQEYITNILNDVIDENQYWRSMIKKYIDFVYYNDNEYYEIDNKLSSICCYYNNISDLFYLLDEIIRKGNKSFHPNRKNHQKYNATFNVLVIGRPGSGKSTLINLLLNKKKAKEGIGLSVTKIVSKFIHDKYPISFQDTPGFENDLDLKRMKNFLFNTNYVFDEGKNKYHLVLYVINASNERSFIGEEVDLINYIINEMKLPLFFVCTKSKNEDCAKDFEEVIKLNLWQKFGEDTNLVDHIYSCHLLNEKDGKIKRFGIDNLLKGIQEYYNKEIIVRERYLFGKNNNEEKIQNIFLRKLNNSKDFYNYLDKLSHDIIEKYINFIQRQEDKKTHKKQIELEFDEIIEMLIDHLALELNGQKSGKEYYIEYNNEINYNKNNLDLKAKIEEAKKIGNKVKNDFLEDIKKKDPENYLKEIINDYKNAINSLPNLNEDLEKD